MRKVAVINHHQNKHSRRNHKINKFGHNIRDGEYETRKVNFGNDGLIARQRRTGFSERAGKKLPKKKSNVDENRVGDIIGRDLCHSAKKNTENNHRRKRLDQRPKYTNGSLLVSYL